MDLPAIYHRLTPLATACGLWALPVAPALAQVTPGAPSPAAAVVDVGTPADAGLARLRMAVAPGARIEQRVATGLRLRLPGETAEARATGFVTAFQDAFGLPPGGALTLKQVNGRSARFEQTHGDLPVRHGGLTLAFDASGLLMGYTNEVRAIASVRPATLDAAGALHVAHVALNVPEGARGATARGMLLVTGTQATPVYEVDLLVRPPLDLRRVLVDAVEGRIIGQEGMVRP